MAKLSETSNLPVCPVNLDKLGKKLKISSKGKTMRVLECPKCSRVFIREYKAPVKYADCVCGVRIKLLRRWYD